MTKKLVAIMGVLILVLSLLSVGCAKRAPTPTATPKPTPIPTVVSAEEFYKKNTVTLIVPAAAGGGIDYAGRLFASFWFDVTGGTIVVKNVVGGASMVGVNGVYEAKPDGLTIGVDAMGGAIIAPALFKDPAVRYDPKKFNWIGVVGESKYVLTISSKLPYKSLDELKQMQGFRFGLLRLFGDAGLAATLLIDALPLNNAKLVPGYQGTAEVSLALGRGEIDGHTYAGHIARDDIAKGWGKAPPLVVFDVKRTAEWPNTPALPEVVKLTPQQERLFTVVRAVCGGRAFFLPPGVAQDRVQFVRDAFDKMVKLDGFIRMGKTAWPVWVEPARSVELTKSVDAVFTIPQDDITRFQQLVEKYKG